MVLLLSKANNKDAKFMKNRSKIGKRMSMIILKSIMKMKKA
jgi:hypothetical protein